MRSPWPLMSWDKLHRYLPILPALCLFAPQSHARGGRSSNDPSLVIEDIIHYESNRFSSIDDAAFGP
jgi:hypothetical protein